MTPASKPTRTYSCLQSNSSFLFHDLHSLMVNSFAGHFAAVSRGHNSCLSRVSFFEFLGTNRRRYRRTRAKKKSSERDPHSQSFSVFAHMEFVSPILRIAQKRSFTEGLKTRDAQPTLPTRQIRRLIVNTPGYLNSIQQRPVF